MARIKRQKQEIGLPRIGKIKVGELVERNGKTFPQSLDYFRATGKYASHFHKVYGDKPNQITIVFVTDNLDVACDEEYHLRDKAGGLYGRGDGETFRIWNGEIEDYVTATTSDYPNLMDQAEKKSKSPQGWQAVLTLRFIIPTIPGVVGMWELQTKGERSSLPQIRDAFDFVRDWAGTVVNIPFNLTVEKVKSQRPGSKSKFPVIQLIPNVTKENMEMVRNALSDGYDVKEVKQLLSNNEEQ